MGVCYVLSRDIDDPMKEKINQKTVQTIEANRFLYTYAIYSRITVIF